jgi:hypothetical protein
MKECIGALAATSTLLIASLQDGYLMNSEFVGSPVSGPG